jgi:hypothetical protein
MHITNEDKEKLPKLYYSGLTIPEVAKETGYTTEYVRRRLKALEVTLRPARKRAKARVVTERICNLCKQTKELSEFSKNQYRCRPCEKVYQFERTVKKFGLSMEEYNEFMAKQDSSCAICNSSFSHKRNGQEARLAIDHDHKTGKVRGLLCGSCNRALGLLKEDKRIVQSAVQYLERVEKEG